MSIYIYNNDVYTIYMSFIHTYIHTLHTCTHSHMHTCTHAHMHTCTHIIYTLWGKQVRLHIYNNAYIHILLHPLIHIHPLLHPLIHPLIHLHQHFVDISGTAIQINDKEEAVFTNERILDIAGTKKACTDCLALVVQRLYEGRAHTRSTHNIKILY